MNEQIAEPQIEEVDGEADSKLQLSNMLAPGLMELMQLSMEFTNEMNGAKTNVKREYFKKKLRKNNDKVLRMARLYNLISSSQKKAAREEMSAV